ncbi:MAG: Stp1/IreP family PP2C-type Ser/Thr phosphatase, partial [Nannocystaceae bacterium]
MQAGSMQIKYWAATDVGRKRADNEDNFLIDENISLFIVADGMGGHASGEVASAIAVHTIREVVYRERSLFDTFDPDNQEDHMEVSTLLEYAVHEACSRVFHKAQLEPEKRGMGTTVVSLLLIGHHGFIAYVGDSRIYLLREDTIYPLTEDHSLMNELIRSGKLKKHEIASSPYARYKNAMTRAVGVYETVEVDVLDFEIAAGDSFLLCSDGLYEYLDEADIATQLSSRDTDEIPGRLIDIANTRGGKDNITALVIQAFGDARGKPGVPGHSGVADVIRRVPLFLRLNFQQLSTLRARAKLRDFTDGEKLAAEGEDNGELAVVLEGSVRLSRRGRLLRTLKQGDYFGELDLMALGKRQLSATAQTAGRLLIITREALYHLIEHDPRLAVKLLWGLSHELSQQVVRSLDE